ncbi:MAG: phospholipid carrier-dependent glycosyltransferase [Candidatus Moranbacteria bacterium]|nr:phospholipid carrier-dependent glycosyltransferase [Candidatus Moranbacteria bacterium]
MGSIKKYAGNPKALLLIPLIIFFSFGLYHLTDFITSDEHYWFGAGQSRIGNYWEAVANRDWKGTRINDKPGVTLAYSSISAVLIDRNPDAQILSDDGTARVYDPSETKRLNFLYRFPILLIGGLFSLYFFWIIRKITDNPWIALYATTFILLSPIVIGMSQIVNPDSLFWIFTFSGVLTFMGYLKEPSRKLVALTTLFFGLGMASKYVAFILVPFILFMILAYFFMEFDVFAEDREKFRKRMFGSLMSHLAITFGGFLIFALMMPAIFTDIKYLSQNTIGSRDMVPVFWLVIALDILLILENRFLQGRLLFGIFEKLKPLRKILPPVLYAILIATFVFVLVNWISGQLLASFKSIPFDMKLKDDFAKIPFLKRYAAEAVPLAFSLTPLAILSLFYLWAKGLFNDILHKTTAFMLSSFILIFFLASIAEGLLLQIRYSMILYPVASFLCGLAVFEFFSNKENQNANDRRIAPAAAYLTILLIIGGVILYSLAIKNGMIKERSIKEFLKYHEWFWFVIPIAAAAFSIFIMKKFPIRKPAFATNGLLVFVGIVAISFASIWHIKPFYFNYTSSILPQKYMITAAWGYGGYEAAEHMNKLPGARNLTVWADSYGFCEFFVGKCIHKTKVDTEKYRIDYYYNTLRGQLKPSFPHPRASKAVWQMKIDNRGENYLKIYKAVEITGTDQE